MGLQGLSLRANSRLQLETVRVEIDHVAKWARRKLCPGIHTHFKRSLASKQISRLFEVFWQELEHSSPGGFTTVVGGYGAQERRHASAML